MKGVPRGMGRGGLPLTAVCLVGRVSPDQMGRDHFVQTTNGESVYRYWTFRTQDIAGRSRQLCPNGSHEIAPLEVAGRMTIFNLGLPIAQDQIWVMIACPSDLPA